jgi:ribosomal protein L11 methyltransferase
LFSVHLKLTPEFEEKNLPIFEEMFESDAFSAIREGNREEGAWLLHWLCSDKPAADCLPSKLSILEDAHEIDLSGAHDFLIEETPERDWLEYSYQQFPAFEVGSFFIYGSHHEGEIPDKLFGLQIDAATAFGSGEHGTTAGCLLAMEWLEEQGMCPWHVLDMGTGSGILAIAAWKLWKTPVLAVDNDDEAVRVAEKHRVLNKVPDGKMNILCKVGDGFAAEIVQQRRPYELVIANILAGPLKDMAADLRATLDDGGRIILSGILDEQAQSVIDAYTAQNLTLIKEFHIEGWSTLVFVDAST